VEAAFQAPLGETSEGIDDIIALVPPAKPNAVGLLTDAGGLEGTSVEPSRIL
jgi:hypothetical protein